MTTTAPTSTKTTPVLTDWDFGHWFASVAKPKAERALARREEEARAAAAEAERQATLTQAQRLTAVCQHLPSALHSRVTWNQDYNCWEITAPGCATVRFNAATWQMAAGGYAAQKPDYFFVGAYEACPSFGGEYYVATDFEHREYLLEVAMLLAHESEQGKAQVQAKVEAKNAERAQASTSTPKPSRNDLIAGKLAELLKLLQPEEY